MFCLHTWQQQKVSILLNTCTYSDGHLWLFIPRCWLTVKLWFNSRFSFLVCTCCRSCVVLGLLKPHLLPLFVPHSQTHGQQQHDDTWSHQHKRHRRRFIFPAACIIVSSWTAAAIHGSVHRYHAPHNHHNAEGNEPDPQSTQCILGTWVSVVFAAVVVIVVAAKGWSSVCWSVHTGMHIVSPKMSVPPAPVRSKTVERERDMWGWTQTEKD